MDTTSALSFSLTVPSTKFHYSPLIFAFQQLSTNRLFESSTILPILDIIFSPSYFSSHNYGTITISLITDYSKKKKGSPSRKRTLSYKWKRSKKKKKSTYRSTEGDSSFSHKFYLVPPPRHGYCFDPFRVHGGCRHKFSSARPESRANNLFGDRRHPPPSSQSLPSPVLGQLLCRLK